MKKMICALIFLFISLAASSDKMLFVDISKNYDPFHGPFINNIHHDSGCSFVLWQKAGRGRNRVTMLGSAAGIRDSQWIALDTNVNLNKPLYISTTCGDALWVDQFSYTLSGTSAPGTFFNPEDVREYGSDNNSGWCVSTDQNDWKYLGGHSVQNTCYHTLELEAYNNINEGSKGRVTGHYKSWQQLARGRRVLESESKRVNAFGVVLQEYFHCVQTLADDQACESLSTAALELFDQDDVVVLSGEYEAENVDSNEKSEDAESNDRRKI